VAQKDAPIYREWIGTLDGLVSADIKAEVSGYLVKKGHLLFQIDPRPLDAALAQTQGRAVNGSGRSRSSVKRVASAVSEGLVAV
jgi:multidrug resistance efflux pump